MAKRFMIQHPEWLQIAYDGKISYGYNQEWYHTEWQRVSGCGPTTGTQLINYVSFRDGRMDPSEVSTKEQALEQMELVWPYVQPRRGGGLFKTRWQFEGLSKFVAEKGMPYEARMLRILPFKNHRPPVEEVGAFMEEAFQEDCPIAFLNRHRGKEQGLQTWHWIPLIGMERKGNEIKGITYDDELKKEFSMTRWLKDTIFGGGLVFLANKS